MSDVHDQRTGILDRDEREFADALGLPHEKRIIVAERMRRKLIPPYRPLHR